MKPKVLIAIPTYDGMSYCLNEFLEAINKLTYSNFDVLIVDNSKTDEYSEKIRDLGFKVLRSQKFENPRETIVEARNLLRSEFLKGDYDYFFSVEQDVILVPDMIQKMLQHQKDIISGVYYKIREIAGIKNYYPLLMVACDEQGNAIETDKIDCSIRDMYRHEVDGDKLIPVEASGLGCIMILRNVVEKVRFRYDPEKQAFDDMLFALDSKKQGFKIWADTSLKCKHLLEGKPAY